MMTKVRTILAEDSSHLQIRAMIVKKSLQEDARDMTLMSVLMQMLVINKITKKKD